jgi:hypothetical protein
MKLNIKSITERDEKDNEVNYMVLGMRYAARELMAEKKKARLVNSSDVNFIQHLATCTELAGRDSIFWKKAKEFIG